MSQIPISISENLNTNISNNWKDFLLPILKDYEKKIDTLLNTEQNKNEIYPKYENIFAAFKKFPIDDLRVVIIGQDPYHSPGLANGYCFSDS
jgi:uracil-DNA glycosylase